MMGYDELERVLGKAASAYSDACRRHPVFPKRVTNEPVGELTAVLKTLRRLNDIDGSPRQSIRSVQSEELLEAVIEGKRRNWSKAKAETLHLIATAIRAYEFYDEMERGSSAKSPFTNGRKNATIRGVKTPMKIGDANER